MVFMGIITETLLHWRGGLEIKILKANGRAKEKGMCLKEQQIYQSNCLEFTWDFMLNKYQCL